MTGENTFRFLDVEGQVAQPEDWNSAHAEKLWLYILHYFDDLNAVDATQRAPWHRTLVSRWIAENPPMRGNGWEPYPLSLRIANWIIRDLSGTLLDPSAKESLQLQVRALRSQLEFQLLGNHLWANAKALTFAGAYFEGHEAEGWLNTGLKLIERELTEQVLDDGGHFELSPMYHAIVLDDLAELVALDACFPGRLPGAAVQRWRATIAHMLDWLDSMSHPDGDPACFNDCAFGIAPRLADSARRAKESGVVWPPRERRPIEAYPQSGYVRLNSGAASVFCDVGQIGPDYLPGHAHADTLSFELSLFGKRLVVDPGTSTYSESDVRLTERGTAAHNTVVVDGQDSSEVWASFRVARRAKPLAPSWKESPQSLTAGGAHDGYRRLRGKVIHRRQWELTPGCLCIEDRLEGTYGQAVGGFLLHPDWRVSALADGTIKLVNGPHEVIVTAQDATLDLHPAVCASGFNDLLTTTRIHVQPTQAAWSVWFRWAD
jgi:uncharacterized heparinase superfamily protein